MQGYDFNNLFVCDLANNHQGDLDHGLNIINAIGDVAKRTEVKCGFKFQFRQLDTFIHDDYKHKADIKHIPRFMETALTKKQYQVLVDAVKAGGMRTICTPFDEQSVSIILELGIDIIKIASCSATDWPLLETVSHANRPVIVSTAGLSLSKIDRLVSFFNYRMVDLALMHCVALYPTPEDKLNLNQITLLRNRYPDVAVGFSTHEHPENFSAVQIAYAKGAQIFERHVGIANERHKLNNYSATPAEVEQWINAYKRAVLMCGGKERSPASPAEVSSLQSLMRGVYAKQDIQAGETINRDDVFFAMPLQAGQLCSGEWFEGITADKSYKAGAPVSEQLANLDAGHAERIFGILLQVKGLLNLARVFIGKDASIEISHHYGLERFREFGAVIINCINRAYCKKLIVMLPRQKHPYHYHKRKEETFQLLSGDLEVEKNGHKTSLSPGDTLLIKPEQWHKFHTLDGAVFEEISTTHYDNDSFYEDERIARLPRAKRKTELPNWADVERKAADQH